MNNVELYRFEGSVPVLSNSSINNGVGGYCGLKPTEQGNIITFSDTTMGGETMFYQAEPFIGYAHVQGMYPIEFKLNEKIAVYFISVIRRAVGNSYDYANKFNRSIVKNIMICLPAKEDGTPDYDFMERYIRAIEKVTIADAVKWKDKQIEITKQVVDKTIA